MRINHKQRENVTTSPSAHNSCHHVCMYVSKQRENVTSFCWWDYSKSKIPCHKQKHTHTHTLPSTPLQTRLRAMLCLFGATCLLLVCWFVSCFRSRGTHERIDLRETCASSRSRGTATTTTTTTNTFTVLVLVLVLFLEAAKHML